MLIRSATSLRNGYDEMVKLAKEKREPIYLTQNGDGEMVLSRWISGKSARKNWICCSCCSNGSSPGLQVSKSLRWTKWNV